MSNNFFLGFQCYNIQFLANFIKKNHFFAKLIKQML